MTISANTRPFSGPFEGNGIVSRFTFNFRAFGVPEMVAVWVKKDGTDEDAILLDQGVDYAFAQATNSENGSINLLPGGRFPVLPVGYLLAIAGRFPESQDIPFRTAERFFAPNHEIAYDYTVQLIKKLRLDIQKVFDIPDSPFDVPKIWINGLTIEEYVRMLADREVERAFGPKETVFVTEPELILGTESHRVVYIILNECTVFVPPGMPAGWTCDFQRAGAGEVTFDTPEGMQWWSVDISKTIQHQYAWANLMCLRDSVMSLSGDVYGKGNGSEPGQPGPGEFFARNGEWYYRPLDGSDLRDKMSLWDDPAYENDPHSLVTFSDIKGVIREVPANNMDVTHLGDLHGTFEDFAHFNQYIGGWDTSRIRSFNRTFRNAVKYDQPFTEWTTSVATSFTSFLEGASAFNQPLEHFDMKRVLRIPYMLKGASSFNQPVGWEFEALIDIRGVCDGALSFNQHVGSWKVGNVRPAEDWSMTFMDRAFANTPEFNQDLTPWCVPWYRFSTGQPRPPFEFAEGSALQPNNFPNWGTCPE